MKDDVGTVMREFGPEVGGCLEMLLKHPEKVRLLRCWRREVKRASDSLGAAASGVEAAALTTLMVDVALSIEEADMGEKGLLYETSVMMQKAASMLILAAAMAAVGGALEAPNETGA